METFCDGSACPHKTSVLVFGLPLSIPGRTETTLASGQFGWQTRYVYSGESSTDAFQGVRLAGALQPGPTSALRLLFEEHLIRW